MQMPCRHRSLRNPLPVGRKHEPPSPRLALLRSTSAAFSADEASRMDPLFPPHSHATRSPSLLIVDDDIGFVHAAAEIARMQGFEITVAGELRQAMHRVKQRDFDLALVDLDLPDGSGLSLLEDMDNDRMRALVVTGKPTMESAVQSLRNSVVDYLVKPIAPERLRQLLQSCAGRRRVAPP